MRNFKHADAYQVHNPWIGKYGISLITSLKCNIILLYFNISLFFYSYRNGEEWSRVRNAVKFMLSPTFVEKYFPSQEEITTDFVNRIFRIRDSKGQVNDFLTELYRFTEECE